MGLTKLIALLCFLFVSLSSMASVSLGIDQLIEVDKYRSLIKNKRVGLITNQTGINSKLQSTIDVLKQSKLCTLVALFAPEHGIDGFAHAEVDFCNLRDSDGLPIHSLHGKTRRPNDEMLKGIDLLIFDIQDIGSRSYTYATTLFYCMEEAAKRRIKVVVTDRPNPMGGNLVDGLLLDPKFRSYVGYVNVPYCHGMTVGELARFFNEEYKIGCDLAVVPMKGWKRSMTFAKTGLQWIPTSPHVPEMDTPFYYPTTGILGELQIINVGVGYTIPFKVIGAPWIDSHLLASKLNAQKFPGVYFLPVHYQPFFGTFANQDCYGVRILITDSALFLPVTTQYLILGVLKSLYPEKIAEGLKKMEKRKDMFCKVNGNEEVYQLLIKDGFIAYRLKTDCQKDSSQFLNVRKKYLLSDYKDK